jgi:glyoxylase-like metal-dependent hydrolase (beta-lactamase superfamily II)
MKISVAPVLLNLAVVNLALVAVPAFAQDFSKVEIKTTKISNNFYTLDGQGGTIGVLAGPDGVFMVDTQFAPLSEKIVAAIRKITEKPIRFVVNTHVHGDHTGGNENFGKMGAVLLSREELSYRLAHPAPGANGAPGTPAPAAAMPTITYRGPLTFHMNGEDIELIPVPVAHTDGDTMVRFVKNDVVMCGDFYRSIQYPNIDRANGGSLNGMLEGMGLLIGTAGPNTKIIPGHGPVVNRSAVMTHRDMILAVRDRIAPQVQQGKTLAEVVASKPTADYDAKIDQAGTTGERFVGQVYAELQAAK